MNQEKSELELMGERMIEVIRTHRRRRTADLRLIADWCWALGVYPRIEMSPRTSEEESSKDLWASNAMAAGNVSVTWYGSATRQPAAEPIAEEEQAPNITAPCDECGALDPCNCGTVQRCVYCRSSPCTCYPAKDVAL